MDNRLESEQHVRPADAEPTVVISRSQRIHNLYMKGHSAKRIAREVNCTPNAVYVFISTHGLARRSRPLSDEQKEIIRRMAEGYEVRRVAREAGCSRTQAHKYMLWYRRREIEKEAEQEGMIAIEKLNRPKACPVHGRIKVWPCVICAAEAAAQKRLDARRRAREVGRVQSAASGF